MVLRDKDGTAINVSYSESGLKWTTLAGRTDLIFYKDAKLKHQKLGSFYLPYIDGDTSKSPNYRVEKFIPTDQKTGYQQKMEFRAIDKALKLLYNVADQ